jgi:hypothetical protein
MGKRLNGLRRKAAGLRAVDGRESALSLSQGRLSPQSDLSNRKLIQQFESDAIPAGSFHHADHVRLAFAYLCQYPPLQALEKFSAALKRFAAARGKSQLYHERPSPTRIFFLIRERMARPSAADWDEFCRRNPDLLTWQNGILTRYYEEATLQSDLARTVFLFPDKFPSMSGR